MRRTFFLFFAGLLLLSAPTSSLAEQSAASTTSFSSHAVVLDKVKRVTRHNAVRYPARVAACRQAQLAFRVGGPLIEINIKPGDVVKKGQLLMQIDPQDFKDRIAVLEARLNGALSLLVTAKLDLQREQPLVAQQALPQASFDHTLNRKETAAASVAQIRAELVIAKRQLAYTRLTAPYHGVVLEQRAENYEMIAPGRTVLTIQDTSKLKITASVPENEIIQHQIQAGQEGEVSFPALNSQTFPARLEEWESAADPASKTFSVTFTMPCPPKLTIFPGMTAELTWQSGTPEDRSALVVPVQAVVTDSKGRSLIWVYDTATGTAQKRQVQTGRFADNNNVEIKSGIQEGDTIVVAGMDFITEQTRLNTQAASQE